MEIRKPAEPVHRNRHADAKTGPPARRRDDGVPSEAWTDKQIVQACLTGDERAWELLVTRYRKLIISVPRRYGANAQDSADVFQLVCAELFLNLPRLRDQESLRAWIMQVAKHQAYHWKLRHTKRARREGTGLDAVGPRAPTVPPSSSATDMKERAQTLRRAIEQLSPRDRKLVRLLFFDDPPASYGTVALRLGLAAGSISLTRNRCLQKLARLLAGTDPPGVKRLRS